MKRDGSGLDFKAIRWWLKAYKYLDRRTGDLESAYQGEGTS